MRRVEDFLEAIETEEEQGSVCPPEGDSAREESPPKVESGRSLKMNLLILCFPEINSEKFSNLDFIHFRILILFRKFLTFPETNSIYN